MTRLRLTAATLAFVLFRAGNTALGQSAHDQHHLSRRRTGQGMPMQPGMMGHGTMGAKGPGMMDHGMGPGMMHGLRVVLMMHLSPEDAGASQHHIAAHELQHQRRRRRADRPRHDHRRPRDQEWIAGLAPGGRSAHRRAQEHRAIGGEPGS